ncbi:MAG: archaemetzincin [Planctomycetia bacterium]|nr:archaemetzincin [Planctomycetia bacterium]
MQFLIAACCGVLAAASLSILLAAEPVAPTVAEIRAAQDKLRPLHKKLGPPQKGDWLLKHPEPGQTFDQYLRRKPVTPTGKRRVIYVLPIGEFDKDQQSIVDLTTSYLILCYNRRVQTLPALPLSVIPKEAQRVNPGTGDPQILTTHLLVKLLPPRLPDDGAALIALTATDLWPGEGWNFVFGQASLQDRVGVWSIHRNGDPAAGEEEFRLCLRRTLKTSSHELGHMFSIQHCTAYQCNMCGGNSLSEADRQPLAFCPECAGKIWWATGTTPADFYRKLADFYTRVGLKDDAQFCKDSLSALGGEKKP